MASEATGESLGRRLALVATLAFNDYRHEWVVSGCAVLALAAVLTPLLALFGLKYGLISNLLDPLTQNPRYREIVPTVSGNFDSDWFAAIRKRPDVAFVVPKTRSLAASIKLRAPDSDVGRIIDVEIVPSAAGDPVLPPDQAPPQGFSTAVLAAGTAERLGVTVGDEVEGLLTRRRLDRQESERLPLTVIGVAPVSAFARDGVFVSAELIAAVEDFLDGRAVAALDWPGTQSRPVERAYAGFRLYARTLDDVAPLSRALRAQGIDVRTSMADISLVKTLDRSLSAAYWIIAAIAIVGFSLSFATSVWANIERKQREFSVLRLSGFRTREIVCFPIVQALFTAFGAWLLAGVAFAAIQAVLNALLAADIGGGEAVCRLRLWHLGVALVGTAVAAALAAAAGGRRVAELEPSIGLHRD